MSTPNIITAAERAARQGQPAMTPRPMAQFRKKGCKTCSPIPAPTRSVQLPLISSTSILPASETVLDALKTRV